MAKDFTDNQSLAPGDRAHLDAVSGNDDVRAEGRAARAKAWAASQDVSDQVGRYVEPTEVSGGQTGVGVTQTPAAAAKK